MLHQRPIYGVPPALDDAGAPPAAAGGDGGAAAAGGGAGAGGGGALETRGLADDAGALGRRSAPELLQLLHLVLRELSRRGADALATALGATISGVGAQPLLCALLLVWVLAFASAVCM